MSQLASYVLQVLQPALSDFKSKYPFLCSKHKSKPRRYPSEILPGRLYLGDMKHAEDTEALETLGVSFIITIFHERPPKMRVPRTMDWLYLELPDSEVLV